MKLKAEGKITLLERLLDDICGGLDQPGTGVFFTVPVDYMHGMGCAKTQYAPS